MTAYLQGIYSQQKNNNNQKTIQRKKVSSKFRRLKIDNFFFRFYMCVRSINLKSSCYPSTFRSTFLSLYHVNLQIKRENFQA